MTDADDRRDDLASGLLDGTLPGEAAAAARRDPAVAARVAELAAARDRLRQVPPPDPAARDRAVVAALAAFDPGADRDQVAHLASARQRRAAGAPRWLGAAAAAVAVVAAVAGVAVMAGDAQDEDQATSSESLSDEAGDQEASSEATDDSAADAAGEDGGAGSAAPEATLAAGGDLGSFTDATALVDRVAAELRGGDFSDDQDAPRTQESPVPSPATGCAQASLPPAAQRDGARFVGTAEVVGTLVDVWVVPDPDAGDMRRVVAVSATCEAVVDQPLG